MSLVLLIDQESVNCQGKLRTYIKIESWDMNLGYWRIWPMPLVFKGMQRVHRDFLHIIDKEKNTSRAYSCAGTRPCMTDPKVLPS
jgi:hypothetical protein